MTDNTRTYDRFEYHLEDLDCGACLYYQQKRKNRRSKYYGCNSLVCCCMDIRADAIRDGRVIREKGWNKHWLM